MRTKTIAGVRFSVRKESGDFYLYIKSGEQCVALPPKGNLQLHHLQALEDWLRAVQQEIESDG